MLPLATATTSVPWGELGCVLQRRGRAPFPVVGVKTHGRCAGSAFVAFFGLWAGAPWRLPAEEPRRKPRRSLGIDAQIGADFLCQALSVPRALLAP